MSDQAIRGEHPRLLVRVARRWDAFGLPALFLLLVAIFSALSPSFRSGYSLLSNLSFSSLGAVGCIGMVFCIMTADMDISVGSMAALAGVFGASLVPVAGGVWGMLVTIVISTILGAVNGLFVTKLRIPAFITTLGMQFVYRAFAYIYTTNAPVYIKDPAWLFVAGGNVFGIPFPIILTAICFAVAVYVVKKTPFGRWVVAVGTNKSAAMLSGINVDLVKIIVFVLVGFSTGIATVINGSFLGSINPGMTGQGFEFQVITIAVLGGTQLTGGNGNMIGALFAAMFITFLQNGLGVNQVNSYWQYIATGLVLIFAVGINRLKSAILGQGDT